MRDLFDRFLHRPTETTVKRMNLMLHCTKTGNDMGIQNVSAKMDRKNNKVVEG